HVISTVNLLLQKQSGAPEHIAPDANLIIDVVNRLLKFLWDGDVEGIRDGLEAILCAVIPGLNLRDPDQRKINGKITDLLDVLEKPWSIKVAHVIHKPSTDSSELVLKDQPVAFAHLKWRLATVGWLCDPTAFNPHELPKMHTPGGQGNGVYSSPSEYMDTLMKLMVAITFEEGNSALSPLCRVRGDKDMDCGKVLRPLHVSSQSIGSTMQCSKRGCSGRVILVCADKRHNQGLCAPCGSSARRSLLGPPGMSAATHLYDGIVSKATFDGRLYLKQVLSRKPPLKEIHWRTSKRLQSPNLVGLVKLSSRGANLNMEMRVVWAEIVDHSRERYAREDEMRKSGQLAVSILNLGNVFAIDVESVTDDALAFKMGDFVAVIDCQTFVPEFIPVLKALEIQRQTTPLPFQDGVLLNLSFGKKALRSQVIEEVEDADIADIAETAADSDDDLLAEIILGDDITVDQETRYRIECLVAESELDPIIQIRRSPNARNLLERRLMELVQSATLDSGQFDSFIGSLMYPVHCTQGPPGTGKSYLGVVIARALLRIREIWMQISPSVAAPPLLILSYKNHAIDEFLCDLVQAEPRLSMVRIGSIKDERLRQFSESSYAHSNAEVVIAREKLDHIHNLKLNLDAFFASMAMIGLARSVMFAPLTSDFVVEKERKKVAYEAAMKLKESLVWLGKFPELVRALTAKPDEQESVTASGNALSTIQYENIEPILSEWEYEKSKHLPSEMIEKLYDGIKHYNESMDSAEILWRFITGFTPQPLCAFPCPELSSLGSLLCPEHQCAFSNDFTRCDGAVVPNREFCEIHYCHAEQCDQSRIVSGGTSQSFCEFHACFVCIRMGLEAGEAFDSPPRNVCKQHLLCMKCQNLADSGDVYCAEHQRTPCKFLINGKILCKGVASSKAVPFCSAHQQKQKEWMPFFRAEKATLNNEALSAGSGQCQSKTSKGKPCKTPPAAGQKYCKVHKDKIAEQTAWEMIESNVKEADSGTMESISNVDEATPIKIQDFSEVPDASESSKMDHVTGSEDDLKNSAAMESVSPAVNATEFETQASSDFADDSGSKPKEEDTGSEDDFMVIDAPAVRVESMDEYDVPDHLQHLREIGIPGDNFAATYDDGDDEAEVFAEAPEDLNEDTEGSLIIASHLWGWEMSIDDRWKVCQGAIGMVAMLKTAFDGVLRKEVNQTRRELHYGDVRARSKVYEGKSVIGGTIVGCISRLEPIRNTNPFAVLVEEASEVMEPLLFACLGTSTIKLEMVGDHLQLQPSMMSKFEFEQINKMNTSLFERLIRAPEGFKVPSSVLSIQRRMRPNIADLTRNFYDDITAITDHKRCLSRKIGEDAVVRRGQPRLLDSTESKGWEVPGLSSNLFLWTHNGHEERASVGLSKVNRVEAKMVCNLAMFLVSNGVPVTSIAIITPYKGQMMELRRMLEKPPYKLVTFKDPKHSLTLSTVDRFQGDEADIVIGSLVVDANTKSPFARLVNRMIVLNSRARIGYYLVANLGYFEKNSVPHWASTIKNLSEPAPMITAGASSDGAFTDARIGHKLPLCCPQHRTSTASAATAANVKLGFCDIEAPCLTHPQAVDCAKLFSLAKVAHKLGVDAAKAKFRCDAKVDVQLPCTHRKLFDCADEKEFSSGTRPFPKCLQQCLSPFVYPTCKHELHGKCHQITQYINKTATVPTCSEDVEYIPACGHSVTVKCSMRQLYESKTASFACAAKVDVNLPRCLHAVAIPCPQALGLKSYSGQAVNQMNRVLEGVSYGPTDAVCKQRVTFLRKCGHKEQLPCDKAFSMSSASTTCGVSLLIKNPYCGHEAKVLCAEKTAVEDKLANKGLTAPQAVMSIREGEAGGFGELRIAAPCTTKIRLIRKCGHEEEATCHSAENVSTACQILVTARSGLCGHEVSVPCGDLSLVQAIWDSDTIANPAYKMLMDSGVLFDNMPIPLSIPSKIKSALLSCKHSITVRRTSSCNHTISMACKEAFKLLLNASPMKGLKPCKEQVLSQLGCGHTRQQICSKLIGDSKIACSQRTIRKCWNFNVCSQQVDVVCGSPESPRCSILIPWDCPAGHKFDLPVCSNGYPLNCPSCASDRIDQEIQAIEQNPFEEADPFMRDNNVITEMFKEADDPEKACINLIGIISSTKAALEEMPLWDRPILTPFVSFGFIPVNGAPSKFDLRSNVKQTTYNGVAVCPWTISNLKKALQFMGSKKELFFILVQGRGIKSLIKPADLPSIPSGNTKAKAHQTAQLSRWIKAQTEMKGYDSMACALNGWEYDVFWDPFCVFSHGFVRVTKDLLETWIANKRLQVYRPETRRPALVQYKLPHAPGTDTDMKASQAKQAHALNVFKGTVADGITVCTSWNGSSLGLRGSFSQTVEKELHSKLTFVLKASSKSAPQLYAGISYLEALDESLLVPELKLLSAMEMSSLGSNEEAQLFLQEYLHAVQGSEAHPLLLLALARIEIASDNRRSFMQAFDQIAESNSSKWFWPAEVILLKNPVSAPVSSTPTTPREMWDEMKRREGVSSAAMEELVDLIGLKKVKIAALELFKSAIAFSKMSAVARQKNSLALNFSFYGNPGCGKTTVAKLFSAVLSDCKLRPSKEFFHLSPRVLKDEGADKFMERVKKAENGVMFIDEAYNLSPVDDPKGREIVNELLVVSEDMRDKVSIILAGYEDDMQNKLFSFNEGLKSRFQAIMFEDFDSGELEMIWNKMVKDREWKADPRIGPLVARKLAKSANRKGFGNARDVRNKIEEACKRALARDDWDGDMFLRLEDVVGVSPMKNTKLVQLLGELDQRIGWASVKQTVKELVAVCEANYERELKGIDATPVILNRLFLGNPGTGKTTCAGIYAKILKQLNFLTKGELVVSTASDFVGQYVGQSQTKTNALIEKARGNVLLIDEAYNLNDNLYGKQVLDVLVEKVQGSENDDIAVLLCGYDEPMLAMLRDQNPGLARRFPREYAFDFQDYTDSELMQLFDYECANKKVKVAFLAKKAAMEMLAKQRHMPNFGNAGAVNLLIRNAVSKASVRQSAGSDSYLTLEDFGEIQNTDPMRRLEGLYRIDSVKASLIELRDAYNVALKEGSELPNVTNFVFTGSPGTGKTTIARVMAEILFEMGILSTNRLVETSGLGLTGEYIGHTKKRVEEKLGEARGGVLFIDEAYELGKGHFSDEALTSIVASMTNPLYRGMVIILAGYAADIDQMMNKNVGLKSRFTRFFHFDDWTPSDSWLFLSDMANSNNYLIDDEIEDYAMTALQELIKLPGWGNGRDMTYIWKQSLEKRSSRVKNAPETLQKTLSLADISPVIQAMLETRSKNATPVSFSNMPLPHLKDFTMPPLLRAPPKQQEAPPKQQEMMNESKRSDENREVKKDLEKLLEALFDNETALRDHGVSEEAWAELERSKQKRIEELERMRKELEELNRIRDEQERERKRAEFEKKIREEAKKEKALQERIRQICPCPAGFQWFKTGNGWRCGGGSHFVSDAQLQANFTK
ncbi:hypothetical protein HDU80_009611, partial [Chytriomyces hyalinus]